MNLKYFFFVRTFVHHLPISFFIITNSSIVCAHFARQSSYSNARREWKQHHNAFLWCVAVVVVAVAFIAGDFFLVSVACFSLSGRKKLIRKCKLRVCETMFVYNRRKSITLFWSVIWSISKWKYPSKILWMMCHNFTALFSPHLFALANFRGIKKWGKKPTKQNETKIKRSRIRKTHFFAAAVQVDFLWFSNGIMFETT